MYLYVRIRYWAKYNDGSGFDLLRTVNGELPKMVENRVQECIRIQLELRMMIYKIVGEYFMIYKEAEMQISLCWLVSTRVFPSSRADAIATKMEGGFY